ncbi:anti-sigma factor [Demequina globuliformis]|uniref:anti-sigma factor n=1 Tax=Demequina globuliformis TaxID=676202 RepID=UPI000782709D|nr:anti-sigma factor [Demequina globuliformis]
MNDNIHSLAAPYVVDALTDAERAEFSHHLAGCDDCRDEVRSLAGAVDELALAQESAPPMSLKGAVMDEVRRTPQVTPDGATSAAHATAIGDAAVPHDELAGRRDRTPRGDARVRAARRRWVLSGVAAASAVLAVIAGVTWTGARAEREAELALEKDVMMVASAPDAASMDLELGRGHVVTSERMDSLVVMGTAAPMPDDGMEYQLWLVMADGTKMAGPTFMPHDGEYMAVAEGAMGDVAAVAVTVEPPGGSSEPTSDPVCVTEMPTKA